MTDNLAMNEVFKELRRKIEALRGNEWYRYDEIQERTVWKEFDIPTIERCLLIIDQMLTHERAKMSVEGALDALARLERMTQEARFP